MIRLVTDQRERVAEFVAKLDPHSETPWHDCPAIGVEKYGKLLAGFVFPNWDRKAGTIEISVGILPGVWLPRSAFKLAMEYVFDQLACQMLYVRTGEHNDRVRAICRKIGANEYIIPRGRGADEDMIIYTLTDDQWFGHKLNGE